MAASQIPNLLHTLRNSRASRGGRSKRNDNVSARSQDQVVQQTDDDAAGSRLSAVEAGYLSDPFARAFSTSHETVRRMPIINRGTFVRTTAIDRLIQQFLDQYRSKPCQIISIGAGTDTRFFRLLQLDPSLAKNLQYHEIDFPATTSKKIKAIEATPSILSLLNFPVHGPSDTSSTEGALQIAPDKTSLISPSYSIQALDLRHLASPSPPQLQNISPSRPTLVLSECCLTYLPPSTSHAILSYFASTLIKPPAPLQIILYEPLHPDDAFGRTMSANLSTRGISMPGLITCPTLQAHKERLREIGLCDLQEGWDVKGIWDRWIAPEEKEALRRLEMVDEEEEWILLAGHYGVIRAIRNKVDTSEQAGDL